MYESRFMLTRGFKRCKKSIVMDADGLKNEHGFISFKTILILLFLFGIIYSGIKIVPLYITNFMFQQEVKGIAELALHKSDADIKKLLTKKVEEWNIPIKEEDIIIERGKDDINIYTSYNIEVDFLGQYQHTFEFNIDVVKPLQKAG